MEKAEIPSISALRGILRHSCPRCRSGWIFRDSIFRIYVIRLPRMYERCPVCDFKFEREQGYFLGAMYISYALAMLATLIIGLLLWAFTDWGLIKTTLWSVVLFLPFSPPIAMFSRVLWLYLDWAIDPEK
jgi:uncharacterized protein (DUF983 family)